MRHRIFVHTLPIRNFPSKSKREPTLHISNSDQYMVNARKRCFVFKTKQFSAIAVYVSICNSKVITHTTTWIGSNKQMGGRRTLRPRSSKQKSSKIKARKPKARKPLCIKSQQLIPSNHAKFRFFFWHYFRAFILRECGLT